MIYAIYPSALDRGISQDQFWESSVPDILDLIEAIDLEELRKKKDQIEQRFIYAEAVASRIGYIFNDEKKRRKSDILQPWDAYPGLFAEEHSRVEQQEEDAALQLHKKQMEAFAARWNSRRRSIENGKGSDL